VESGLARPHESRTPPGAGRGPLVRFCKEFWERALVEAA
jgi:hypothetical protein